MVFKRWLLISGMAYLAMFATAPARADAPVEAQVAAGSTADGDCQSFGPTFFKTEFTPFCAKFGYDLRFAIDKDLANNDIALQSQRLPSVANPGGGVPMLLDFLKDFRERNFDPRPSIDAQVNLTFVTDTTLGPLVGFINVRGAASFIANGSPVIENTVTVRGAAQNIIDQAWIKVAGFTLGIYPSFFNFIQPGYSFTGGYSSTTRTPMIGYSQRIGDNVAVSVSLEDPTRRQTDDGLMSRYAVARLPDVVGQVRVGNDKALVQVAGAFHQVRDASLSDCCGVAVQTANGWAISGGAEYKTKWSDVFGEAAGDMYGRFMASAAYTRGAVSYLGAPTFAIDYVAEQNGQLHLTNGWSALGSYEHLWTPFLKSTATLSYYEMGMHSNPSDVGGGVLVNFDYKVRGLGLQFGTEYMFQPNWMIGVELAQFNDRASGSYSGVPGMPASVRNNNVLAYVRTVY